MKTHSSATGMKRTLTLFKDGQLILETSIINKVGKQDKGIGETYVIQAIWKGNFKLFPLKMKEEYHAVLPDEYEGKCFLEWNVKGVGHAVVFQLEERETNAT